ncbi:MAG TPA: anthranilate synthase component I family protein [Bacteroidales bacterium]|nr:anthranilate synthase component I family protein [Bacteroidales bacterium]
MQKVIKFNIDQIYTFRAKLIELAEKYETFLLLDSCPDKKNFFPFGRFDMLAGIGSVEDYSHSAQYSDLSFIESINKNWILGHISYNYKNQTIGYTINDNINHIGFQNFYFFKPRFLIKLCGREVELQYSPETEINQLKYVIDTLTSITLIKKKETYSHIEIDFIKKSEYINVIHQLQKHIARGNVYELNYCIDFHATNACIDPYNLYLELTQISPAPFSAFYKQKDKFCISASPERFIQKNGKKIISQPIKGTAARADNPTKDGEIKEELLANDKERAENIMITDLVRNDMAVFAEKKSVKVDELCQCYSFEHVHQLISTISCNVKDETSFNDIINAVFPMGSMTGAPKFNAVKYSDEFEAFNRGLYSGAIGYIDPDMNFDFNVVIRSILYNSTNKHLSIPAGSGITAQSIPENEYDECITKVKALINLINKQEPQFNSGQ